MNSYKLRAVVKDKYWDAVILAPDLLTAALFLKKRSHAEEMPVVLEKNGKRYTRTGNVAYYRNAKLDLLRSGKKLAPIAMVKSLEAAAEKANREAKEKFKLCQIFEEYPYI